MKEVFLILGEVPTVTVICSTVIILALVYVLRDQIVSFIKKKYGLSTKEEVIKELSSYRTYQNSKEIDKVIKKYGS